MYDIYIYTEYIYLLRVLCQVLEDLVKTLVDLSSENTLIVMSYEQRSTGDKPEVEKAFFQV